jgi:hypothetical protein
MANTNWSNGFKVANASATQGPFELLGGKYGISFVGTGSGTVNVGILGPDGTTYIPITAATFTANGYASVDLPPCEVQVSITTFTAVYVTVIPISNRR